MKILINIDFFNSFCSSKLILTILKLWILLNYGKEVIIIYEALKRVLVEKNSKDEIIILYLLYLSHYHKLY